MNRRNDSGARQADKWGRSGGGELSIPLPVAVGAGSLNRRLLQAAGSTEGASTPAIGSRGHHGLRPRKIMPLSPLIHTSIFDHRATTIDGLVSHWSDRRGNQKLHSPGARSLNRTEGTPGAICRLDAASQVHGPLNSPAWPPFRSRSINPTFTSLHRQKQTHTKFSNSYTSKKKDRCFLFSITM